VRQASAKRARLGEAARLSLLRRIERSSTEASRPRRDWDSRNDTVARRATSASDETRPGDDALVGTFRRHEVGTGPVNRPGLPSLRAPRAIAIRRCRAPAPSPIADRAAGPTVDEGAKSEG